MVGRLTKVVEPRDGESRDDFISRCMSEEAEAFPDRDQRLAVCGAKFKKSSDGGGLRRGKRRRMTKFTINEVSAVDVPAQEGATAVLMKRMEKQATPFSPDDAVEHLGDVDNADRREWANVANDAFRAALEGGSSEAEARRRGVRTANERFEKCGPHHDDEALVLLTSSQEGHTHAVWIRGGTNGGETSWARSEGEEFGHSHPWVVDAQGAVTIGEADGHTHAVDSSALIQAVMTRAVGKSDYTQEDLQDVSKRLRETQDPEYGALAALLIKAGAAGSSQEDDMSTPKTPTVESLTGQVADLTKRLELAQLYAGFGSEDRAYFDKLDEAGKADFAKASPEERERKRREAEAAKASENPVVYKADDGTEFCKNDDPRLVSMAKRADEDRRALAKANAANEQATLEKRAESEISNLPGDVKVRAALLKAVDGIEDETLRKGALEAVAAGDKAMKSAFTSVGHRNGQVAVDKSDQAGAEEELERLTKARMEEKGEDYYTAYDAVCKANGELAKRAIGTAAPADAN